MKAMGLSLRIETMFLAIFLFILPVTLSEIPGVSLQDSAIKQIYQLLMQPKQGESCDKAMLNLVGSSGNPALVPFIMYSAKGINDIGDLDNCKKTPNITRFLSLYIRSLPISQFSPGFCVPRVCTPSSFDNLRAPIAKIVENLFNGKNPIGSAKIEISPEEVKFTDPVKEEEINGNYGYYFSLILLVFFGIVAYSIFATVIRQLIKVEADQPQGLGKRLLGCFDLYQNWEILTVNKRQDNEELAFFDGIRVLAIIWIVYAQTFGYAQEAPVINPDGINKFIEEPSKAYIYNASLSVDVFFFLSAFLLTYLILKRSKGQGSCSLKVYIHRLIRYYPMMIIALLTFCFIIPVLGYGPFYFRIYERVTVDCEEIWYRILLFFANYRPAHYECISYVWYICVDFQLFILSPFLIFLYCKNRFFGILFPFLIMFGNAAYTVWLSFTYDIYASLEKHNTAYDQYYYERMYTRGGPYMIGMLCAFLYYEHKSGNGEFSTKLFGCIKNNVFFRVLLYAIGLIGMILIIQAMYLLNKFSYDISRLLDLIYLVLNRDAFVFFLFVFLLPVFSGKGRVVRKLFGNKIFFTLGKLSYGIYMLHQLFMEYYTYEIQRPIYFGYTNLSMFFWGYLFLSIVASTIAFLFIEQPLFNFEKILFPSSQPEKATGADDEESGLVKVPIQSADD